MWVKGKTVHLYWIITFNKDLESRGLSKECTEKSKRLSKNMRKLFYFYSNQIYNFTAIYSGKNSKMWKRWKKIIFASPHHQMSKSTSFV